MRAARCFKCWGTKQTARFQNLPTVGREPDAEGHLVWTKCGAESCRAGELVRPCGRTPDLGIPPCLAHLPRFRVSQGPDCSAGRWAGAGTGCLGLGLVAAQVSTGGGVWLNIGCDQSGRGWGTERGGREP